MKTILFFGAALLVVWSFYSGGKFGPPNVYNMPASKAYQLLYGIKIEPSETGLFGRLNTVVTNVPEKSVTWTAGNSEYCKISVDQFKSTQSIISVSCDSILKDESTAEGLRLRFTRNSVIEMVDARLNGRSYNNKLAALGVVAAKWPEDIVHHANFNEAITEATKMAAEAQRDSEREYNKPHN